MNVPNLLTVIRIFLTFIFIFFLTQDSVKAIVLAFLVFIVASITDFLDGYIARKKNLITVFGKIMDPIADKFLVLSAFYMFAAAAIFPFWMFFIIAFREIGITLLRFKAMRKGTVLAAEKAGKAKTVFQITAIILILVFLILAHMELAGTLEAGNNILAVLNRMNYFLMLGVTLITLYSGVSFIYHNREKFYVR